MRKKLLSLVLALTMMLSMGTVAFAANKDATTGEFIDENTITITKWYNNPNNGVSPAETLEFEIKSTSVTDAAADVTAYNMPKPTVGEITFNEGDAGKVVIEGTDVTYHCRRDITVTLPTYTSVGVYTYTIKEVAGDKAGVTYYTDDIKLVVTVIQGEDGKVRVAAVHTESDSATEKTDWFANEYYAGDLSVKKTVTGNLGDQTKEFAVTVTFTAPDGKDVGAPITYTDGTENKKIETSQWNDGKASVEITLKHDETITFKNVPYGVTYHVVEKDYTSDGYDKPTYRYNEDTYSGFDPVGGSITIGDLDNKVDTVAEEVEITNNKEEAVDTGINLDSMPYILILAAVAVGGVAIISKKRREEF